MPERKVQTIREAIEVALEAVPGDIDVNLIMNRKAVREHVIWFVMGFARCRGVILEKKDITDELKAFEKERRKRSNPRRET